MTYVKNFGMTGLQMLNVANFMGATLQALHLCREFIKFTVLLQALAPAMKTKVQLQTGLVY